MTGFLTAWLQETYLGSNHLQSQRWLGRLFTTPRPVPGAQIIKKRVNVVYKKLADYIMLIFNNYPFY